MTNSKFIECNLKYRDFRVGNMTKISIKNCCVETAMFKGAKTEKFRFEDNEFQGSTNEHGDLEKILQRMIYFIKNIIYRT